MEGGGEREPLYRARPPAAYFSHDAIFRIGPEKARGYYIVLGGAPEADMTLAFHSILEGNVLDAVFGCSALSPEEEPTEGMMRAARKYFSSFMGNHAQERRIIYAYATLFRL